MKTINFKMLVLAREMRGLTQVELAKNVGMTQSNYSKIEKGLIPLRDDLLFKISSELDFPNDFFYKKQLNQLSQFYYRKRLSMTTKELSMLESKFKVFAMCIDELLTSVGIPEFTLPFFDATTVNTPENVATKVRAILNIPAGPINHLVRIMESAGILIYFVKDAPSKFDGMTMITARSQPIFFVNDNIPNDRKRHTIAHELGHLVMHIRNLENLENDSMDDEANTFASEFLMPLVECRSDIENLRFRDLGTLKNYWKVSKASIIHKAHRYKYLNSSRYKTFMIELSRSGERKIEHGIVEIDDPVLIEKLIRAHLNNLQYSKQDIMDILAINETDFSYFFMNDNNSIGQPLLRVVV